MNKTLPNLAYPEDITWWQLLFVILPASILSVVFFIITAIFLAILQFSSWVWKLTDGISIYSHKEPIDDRTRQDT